MTKPNKSKIEQLAEQTSPQDLTAPEESPLPESLFPPVVRRQVVNPSAPAPQLQSPGTTSRKPTDPAPQMPRWNGESAPLNSNPVEGEGEGVPEIDQPIRAMLILTGLKASWNLNHWRVYLPDASQIVASIGGKNRTRWQTGVRAHATYEEWMAEINRFWKDARPGESLPFGGILPTK